MSDLGLYALRLALLAALTGVGVGVAGGRSGRRDLEQVARRAVWLTFAFTAFAIGALAFCLATFDFQLQYVSEHVARGMTLPYRLAAVWGGQGGSLLLWVFISLIYASAAAWVHRGGQRLLPWVLAVLLLNAAFFLALINFVTNPFEKLPPGEVLSDGAGLNPLLQHPLMLIHPVMLYSGFTGFSVPFAFATAALITGRLGDAWLRATRRWVLIPWFFLSIGILLGGRWAYEVLGWGGYWAWDPVENASFMPWLTATAFLHSVMVQERRGMLKMWTITLIVGTFLLTVLGTFLTRSGVLASVHAFTQSPIGPFFLTFLAIVLLGSLALLGWRSETLQSEGRFDAALSRETAFMVNNLLFAAFAFVVLLGTMFPLIAEAARGAKVSVGGPYFNEMSVPIALLLVFLAGVGPALPWRKGSLELLRGKFRWPSIVALVAGVVLAAVGVREPLALLTFVLAVFSAGLLVAEIAAPVRVRRRANGEGVLVALWRVATSNRRRYGGYVVHAGILVIAVGIAASAAFRREAEWTIQRGGTGTVGRYRIQFDSVWAVKESNRDGVIAATTVYMGDNLATKLSPRLNYYPTAVEPIGTPAVRESLREDLYLVLMAYTQDGQSATIKAIVSPMVGWIWLGGYIVGLGALFALWRSRAEASRRAAQLDTEKGRLASEALR